MGDWNTQIGKGEKHNAAGNSGYGETSERGTKLLEFMKQQKMVVKNTLHRNKEARRITWHAPDSITKKQIDYILVPKRFKTSVNGTPTRTMKKPDIGSDHDLVMASIKLKLTAKNRRRNDRTIFDIDKLKDDNIRGRYQRELVSKFAPILLLDDQDQQPQEMCDKFTSTIIETAKNILEKRRKTRRSWNTGEVLANCDRRRQLKSKKDEGDEQMKECRKANKEVGGPKCCK